MFSLSRKLKGSRFLWVAAMAMSPIELIQYSASSGLLAANYAKEMCSCHFVSQIDKAECLSRVQVSISGAFIETITDDRNHRVTAEAKVLGLFPVSPGTQAIAQFDPDRPELGCRLIQGP